MVDFEKEEHVCGDLCFVWGCNESTDSDTNLSYFMSDRYIKFPRLGISFKDKTDDFDMHGSVYISPDKEYDSDEKDGMSGRMIIRIVKIVLICSCLFITIKILI